MLALFVLLMMVTIHEFGHYVAGKLLGFKINEFSIGFGPSLFSRKCKSGEIFSIRLVPLGGYCAFEGEEGGSEDSGAFLKQKPWKRLIVLFNGAFFNFISAIIFCFIMLVSVGYDIPQIYSVDSVAKIEEAYYYTTINNEYTKTNFEFQTDDLIVKIDAESFESGLTLSQFATKLAELSDSGKVTANYVTIELKRDNETYAIRPIISYTKRNNSDVLQENDVILKVNGTNIDFIKNNYLSSLINSASGDSVELLVKRGDKEELLTVNLLDYGVQNADGTYPKQIGIKSIAYKFSFGEALARCVPYTFGFSWKVVGALGSLITGQTGISEVGGPIYTIGTIANLSSQSWSYFLTLLPLIAANLAIFNWLPIPALDGSKILLTLIEWIIGKPLFSQKTENYIHSIGFILLLLLVFIADFYHIFAGF